MTNLDNIIIYLNEDTKRFLKIIDLPLTEGDPIGVLVTKLNQYIEEDALDEASLISDSGNHSIVVKLKGLMANITYYEVSITPYRDFNQLSGQVLLVEEVTEREVKKLIDATIIRISMNMYTLKSVEDTLKYFSTALENIIDLDYVFATIYDEERISYFINHTDATRSRRIIKSHIDNPLSQYVLKMDAPVYLDEKGIEDSGLLEYLSDYDQLPKAMIACPINRESNYKPGVVGLLFCEPVIYPELVVDSLGVVTKYLGQVTEKLKIEQQIHDLAYYDQLTGLANRNRFVMSLEEEIIDVSLTGSKMVAILFLDFSGLKKINDQYGHFVGDTLLKILAGKLKDVAEGMFYIGRLGGDEFGIFTSGSTRVEFEGIARLILDTIDEPCTIEGQSVHVTGNIGISIYREHGIHPEELIHKADEALFLAKSKGESQYYICD